MRQVWLKLVFAPDTIRQWPEELHGLLGGFGAKGFVQSQVAEFRKRIAGLFLQLVEKRVCFPRPT